ncbi:hypothetical protein N7470_004188 [Penicillium chermesinum]|nr:hypothetical protein N7470_004188 [Penicillium chermesinum]
MLSGYLAWFSLLFEPFSDYTSPIQPQARLRPENRPWQSIITGVYGHPPKINIHDRQGDISWSFERSDVKQRLPPNIKRCLYHRANDATDVKWLNNGTSIAAIYSALAVVVNHTPDNPSIDKQITFALCRDNEWLWNAHTIEPLPGNLLAVGTTGQRPWDGILVYNASELVDEPQVLQNVTGVRAIHALIWDEQAQMLWTCGTDAAADGSDGIPAYGAIVGYPFDNSTGLLDKENARWYRLKDATTIQWEWGAGYPWWAGPHDLFIAHLENVTDRYMPGFEVTTPDRHGLDYDSDGEYREFPQSDLKGLSLAPDGSYVYIQSLWRKFRSFHVSLVVHGVRKKIRKGDEIYRSRWYEDMEGWPKPKY